MTHIRKLKKHGGSYYVPLPWPLLRSLGIALNDHCTVTRSFDGGLRIARVAAPEVNPPRYEQHP